MHCRALFCFTLILLFSTGVASAGPSLLVEVEGIEGKLLENVLARLRIQVYSQDSDLSETEILRLHQLSEQDIKSALAPYGFYSPEVTTTLSQDEDLWTASYFIDPGQPVLIDSVAISVVGPGAEFADEFIAEIPALKKGDVLNQRIYEEEKRQILRRAFAFGFLDAEFLLHEIRIDRPAYTADIELQLDTGHRYHFGEIRVDQDIITEELFFRFIEFDQDDYFSARRLQELQRDLYRSDYFSSVVIEGDIEAAKRSRVPVDISVEPLNAYNRFSFGVGYSTDIRAYARFEGLNRLLNRWGHRLFSSVQYGELERYVTLNYTIPVVDPRYNALTGSGMWQEKEWEDTDTELYTAGLLYEYSTPEHYYGVSLEYLNENWRVGETTGEDNLLMPGLLWTWALADDIVTTRHGIRALVELTGAHNDFGSDASFAKLRAEGRAIITPVETIRLIGRGSFGTIQVNSINSLPPSIRFYAGGQKSVRGYKYRTLGPTDPSGTVVGGKILLTGGIECEKQFSENWRGVIFYDAGNAMNDINVDLAHGVGAGIGIVLPFGQARLEFAYPLNDEGEAQYVYLSVGADL